MFSRYKIDGWKRDPSKLFIETTSRALRYSSAEFYLETRLIEVSGKFNCAAAAVFETVVKRAEIFLLNEPNRVYIKVFRNRKESMTPPVQYTVSRYSAL